MKIIVIIPAYNEANSIKNVVKSIKKYPSFDYVIINDASTDNTEEILESEGYNYISLPVNLGIGGGVQVGYKYAFSRGYDIAVQMDGDGQHDAGYISAIVEPIVEGKADFVIGSRFLTKDGFQSSMARRTGINFLSWVIKLFSNVKIMDVTSGFRAVNRKYIRFFAMNYAQDYPEPEAIISSALNGAKIVEVPVVMHERTGGTSSINSTRALYYMIKVTISLIAAKFIGMGGRK